MADLTSLLSALTGLGWLTLGVTVAAIIVRSMKPRMQDLTKFGAGPSGLTMEFAERALTEAQASTDGEAQPIGEASKRGILQRLSRNADLLKGARILWVDDHPENTLSVIEALQRFDASVDTPRSNREAFALLSASRYDVIISDVARDDEGERSDLKGIEFAQQVFDRWGQKTLLFTARFNPLTIPHLSDAERLALGRVVDRVVFGRTTRLDEALHLVLDVLERTI